MSKDESSAAMKPGASPKGWWPDSMLSESGWHVRDRLVSQDLRHGDARAILPVALLP